jgi:hypothetical protein
VFSVSLFDIKVPSLISCFGLRGEVTVPQHGAAGSWQSDLGRISNPSNWSRSTPGLLIYMHHSTLDIITEYADIITDYSLESEGFFRDQFDLERILRTPAYNLLLYLRILLLYSVWRSKGFDVEKAYRELLSVISSLKPRINSAPIQEHSGISQQYQIYKIIGIDNDKILQKTAGLARE